MVIKKSHGIQLKDLKEILNKYPENQTNEWIIEFEYNNLSGLCSGSTLYLKEVESLWSASKKAVRLIFTSEEIKS